MFSAYATDNKKNKMKQIFNIKMAYKERRYKTLLLMKVSASMSIWIQ